MLKLKIKRPIKNPQVDQNELQDRVFSATTNVYKNDYLNKEGKKRKQGQKMDAASTMNMKEILKSDELQSKIRSPQVYEDYEEYHAMGNQRKGQQKEDELKNLDQEINIPNFLSRAQQIQSRGDKNQFYMTQVFNQTNPSNQNKIEGGPRQQRQSMNFGTKMAASQVRTSSSKKIGNTNLNKSQVFKSAIRQKPSPLNRNKADTNQILDKYMNLYDITVNPVVKTRDQKKRSHLNASKLLMNPQRTDLLNSTAPLNLTQLNIYDRDNLNILGMSEAVNSTHNINRNASRESWHDLNQTNSQYYSAAKSNSRLTNNYLTTGNNTGHGISPIKDQRKKQLMIKNILKQDALHQKQFLNLTLQQIIHKQKQTQNDQQLNFNPPSDYEQRKNYKNQKRMDKTLDNISGANAYYNNDWKESSQKLNAFTNNFEPSSSNYANQIYNIPKKTQMKLSSASQQRNKLSSTMKIQDLNQTQVIDVRGGIQSGKKSKNSLKSTQNLNFQDDVMSVNGKVSSDQRKYSAMSTYSMNTGTLPTTSHMNQVKQRKLVSSKKTLQGEQVGNINQHRKKPSQDEEGVQSMLKMYKTDLVGQVKQSDKNNTFSSNALKAYQSQSKHKTNSNLNQYLKGSKRKIQVSQSKTQKSPLGHSYLSNTVNLYNIGYNHYENGNANFRAEPSFMNQNFNPSTINPQAFSNIPKNTCMDLEGKLNPYGTKNELANKAQVKEIQNKTQPIPKQLLEIAKAEAANFSTGTSIIANRQPSADSKGMQIKSRGNSKVNEEKLKHREEDPAKIYNNKNTVILDDTSINHEQSELEDSSTENKLERFILGKQIGQGAYAVVRIATMKKDNKKYAIKIYDKSKLTDTNRQRSVRREIKLLQKMNHQNIVKIYEAFETENHVYLVMEYVGGGSLHSYLKEKPNRRLDEEDAKKIFKQILTALQYCHRKSIAHRDIKLENILLDEDKNVKLIDFGFSTCIPNDKKIKMFCGTPSYMAPEIVMKEEYAGPPADIWASGVLLYALMNGCFPFRGSTDKELYRRICRGTYVMHNQLVSEQFLLFLEKIINTNADDRPTAEELLKNEWFTCEPSKGPDSQAQSITDQKKIFKAKILSKIPIEKSNNNICLLSSDKNPIKLSSHNINLNQGSTQFRSNPLVQQNAETSDYGFPSQNVTRKLNQEAYQAYYNTSGGCNYGMGGNQIPNPQYNNFFGQSGVFVNLQNPQMQVPSYQIQGSKGSPLRQGPPHNLNIQTGHQLQGPLNFNQQPHNQVGTPQVFGSPTAVQCPPGGTVNNNWFIKHVDAFINVYNSPPPMDYAQQQNLNGQNEGKQEDVEVADFNSNYQMHEQQNAEYQDQVFEYDDEIIDSLTQMGYHRSHVVSQLECETSQITQLYSKIKEEKMSKTQQRPLSMQPHSRRTHNHNNGIFPPNFVPSIPDSIKVKAGRDASEEYSRL